MVKGTFLFSVPQCCSFEVNADVVAAIYFSYDLKTDIWEQAGTFDPN